MNHPLGDLASAPRFTRVAVPCCVLWIELRHVRARGALFLGLISKHLHDDGHVMVIVDAKLLPHCPGNWSSEGEMTPSSSKFNHALVVVNDLNLTVVEADAALLGDDVLATRVVGKHHEGTAEACNSSECCCLRGWYTKREWRLMVFASSEQCPLWSGHVSIQLGWIVVGMNPCRSQDTQAKFFPSVEIVGQDVEKTWVDTMLSSSSKPSSAAFAPRQRR